MFFAQTDYLNHQPSKLSMWLTTLTLDLVALPLVLQLPHTVMWVFGVLGLLRLFLLAMGVYALNPWQLLILMLGVYAVVIAQLNTILGLEGGTALLLLLCLVKSYEGKTSRDWQVLILAMMFLLVAEILFSQDLMMGVWGIFSLILMGMCLAVLNGLGIQAALRNSVLGFLLGSFPMAVLFVAMPRREMPLWGLPQQSREHQASTGLSDSMKAGSISSLIQSNEPVFSATFLGDYVPRQSDLYWRVMILGEHDGTQWTQGREWGDNALPVSDSLNVSYRLMLEDDKGRIPALDYPIDMKNKRGFRREAGDMIRVFSRQGVRGFDLQSSVRDELPHHLSGMAREWYTRLPPNFNPRTQALAKTLWAQSGGQAERFIQAAYLYFKKQQFAYTLQPPLAQTANSTDEFLFQNKQGFCEHYADAFVILMRSAGLPARVVVGYQGGEYNSEGGFWQIRSKDAHAWTEVWLPEREVWKRIDPTSAVAANRIENSIETALSDSETGSLKKNNFLNKYLDRGRFYWHQWIVNYDTERQQSFLGAVGLQNWGRWGALLLVAVLGLLAAIVPVWWWWRRSRGQEIEPLAHGFLFLKMRLLGQNRAAVLAMTPNELRAILLAENRLPEDLANLLNDYIDLCYARSVKPPFSESRAWYKRAIKLAKKYQKINKIKL